MTKKTNLKVALSVSALLFSMNNVDIVKATNVSVNREVKPVIVAIRDGGKTTPVLSKSKTVGELLEKYDITLNEMDYMNVDLDALIENTHKIVINRVEVKHENMETEIPFEKEIIESNELPIGVSKIRQIGANGLKTGNYLNTYKNGEIIDSMVVAETTLKEPINEITVKGIRPNNGGVFVDNNNQTIYKGDTPIKYKRAITMEATAYDPTAGSKTAMGTRARVGAVAVDPRVIPLGTKLYIESMDGFKTYGFATAEDTGGAIKGNKIDLFYNSNREARIFGRRNVKVYVLE